VARASFSLQNTVSRYRDLYRSLLRDTESAKR
jgi:hypothetical protein